MGSTYALFADEKSINTTVSSGTVDVSAYVYNGYQYIDDGSGDKKGKWLSGNKPGAGPFGGNLEITEMTPGCGVLIEIPVDNDGTLIAKYRLHVYSKNGIFEYVDSSLYCDADLVSMSNVKLVKESNCELVVSWQRIGVKESQNIFLFLKMPIVDSEPVSLDDTISVSVEFVFGNSITTDL